MSEPIESMEAFDARMLAKLARAGVQVEKTATGYKWSCERLGKSGETGNNFGDLLLALFTMTGIFEQEEG